ncbi:MAG: metallophosphoesterase [Dehalococcoidia bacterium]|nr:MAG: metallophosphoesterase [Dehalococcoidia bacterium]
MPPDPSAPDDCTADFIVFGDSQGSFGYIWPVAPSFDNMVSLLNEMDAPFAVHVGDMYVGDSFFAADVDKQAATFQKDVAKLVMPLYPVMGNHDAQGKGWIVARDIFFHGDRTYYSFDNGDSHFIILDAYIPDSWSSISDEQIRWLEDDLRRNTKPHIFVFVHAPLYPLGWHKGTSLDLDIELRDRLASLLIEYQADVIFNGHEHFYASFEYGGLMQVTTGGAGAKLRTPAQYDELIEEYGYTADEITRWKAVKELHFVCVNTTGTHIEVSAHNLEGDLIDQFVLPS